jgi:phosphoglycolate phosphatase-like HAD superfamily hydrolase
MFTNIIFDLDDTLMDSTGSFILANQQVAKKLELRIPTEDECIAYGNSWEDFIAKTWPGIDVNWFKAQYLPIANRIVYKLIEGVNPVLEEMAQSRGLYVLTKRAKETLAVRVEQTGLQIDLFEEIYCNEDVQFKKPDYRTFNEIFDHILKKDGYYSRSEILSIGDKVDDYIASRDAGLHFVAVRSRYTAPEDFIREGLAEEKIIDSVARLPDWIRDQ